MCCFLRGDRGEYLDGAWLGSKKETNWAWDL